MTGRVAGAQNPARLVGHRDFGGSAGAFERDLGTLVWAGAWCGRELGVGGGSGRRAELGGKAVLTKLGQSLIARVFGGLAEAQ
jgi:hypothetical protein